MGNTRLKSAIIRYAAADVYPWYTGYIYKQNSYTYIFSAEFSVYDRYSIYPITASVYHIIKYLE